MFIYVSNCKVNKDVFEQEHVLFKSVILNSISTIFLPGIIKKPHSYCLRLVIRIWNASFDPVFEKKKSAKFVTLRSIQRLPNWKKSNNNQMKCFLGTMIVVNTKARNFMGIDGGPHKPQGCRNRAFSGESSPPPTPPDDTMSKTDRHVLHQRVR